MTRVAVNYRGHNGYDVEEASDEATIKDRGESLTVQSQTEDTDINVMMRRMGVGAKLPENPRVPVFSDFSGVVTDYQSALNAVIDAQDAFMEFPADVRERFENSPQLMMEFCDNANNWEKARELGILSQSSVDARVKAAAAAGEARQAELIAAAKAAGFVLEKAPKAP